jgi:multidrug resistance efflux pump
VTLLFEIDRRTFEADLEQARAELDNTRDQIEALGSQVEAAQADVEAADATIKQSEAAIKGYTGRVVESKKEYKRQRHWINRGRHPNAPSRRPGQLGGCCEPESQCRGPAAADAGLAE